MTPLISDFIHPLSVYIIPGLHSPEQYHRKIVTQIQIYNFHAMDSRSLWESQQLTKVYLGLTFVPLWVFWYRPIEHTPFTVMNGISYMVRKFLYFLWVSIGRFTHILLGYFINRMTSSNGNVFRVTGHLCGEFTGPRWIPRTKATGAELWCFLWSASE